MSTLARVVDRAIDLQNADTVTGKKRQRFGIPAGDVGVKENSGKDHQDKNKQQSKPAQYRKFLGHKLSQN